MPTPDDFRALARSSPWLCRRAHFTHRARCDGRDEVVEAWLERPGQLRVRDRHGPREWRDGMQADVPRDVVAAWSRMPERYADDVPVARAARIRWAHHVEPLRREDGLVSVRPDRAAAWQAATGRLPETLEVDDPMYDNYRWVAMLDPVELAEGVGLTQVRETTHHQRPAWAARAVPEQGYEPRCGCCPLLWSEVSERGERGEELDLVGVVFPEAHDVVLDRATGFVVSLLPVWGAGVGAHRDDLGFDVEVHASA